ncbi:MFS transporter, partial [Pseudoxanthomonas sp. KAs_5_3]
VVAVLVLVIIPLAFGLREPKTAALAGHREQAVLQAVGEAFRYPSFGLLMARYFVCGFKLAFIGIHMPTYLRDRALPAEVAGYALALIGLFNVFGTYTEGLL